MIPKRLMLVLASLLLAMSSPARASWFERGDVDGSGARNIVDPLQILRALFQADQFKLGCLEAADVDDNGQIEITDAVALLQYLFIKGPRPWPENLLPGCWIDETVDSLACDRSPACSPRAVFYACDMSGSMADSSVYNTVMAEIIDGIAQLSEDDQFGLLFFDAGLRKFPASGMPATATADMKASAIGYVRSVHPGHGTCPLPALLGGLDYAEQSTARSKEILFLTDGFATCPGKDPSVYAAEILAAVRAKNTVGVKIHSIGVGFDQNTAWLRQIAEENGGSFSVMPLP